MSYSEEINKIDLLQQEINSYGELRADVKKKINYKFRLDWNYYSNSMEGNTLTMDETRSVMVGNIIVNGKPIKDVLEMKGHDEVISDILKIGKGIQRISEAKIRNIHKGIMHEEDESKKKKIGSWKTEPNYIFNYKNERFDFASPEEVPERIHALLNRTNAAIDAMQQNKKGAPHPVDVALQFHLDYVLIHPFYDGNGRTARVLTNLLLISFGFPPFWIKTNERNIYNQYIGDIQGYGGKPDLFFEFAADKILRSQQIILDAISGKDITSSEDFDKEIELLKRMQNPSTSKDVKIKSSKQTRQAILKEVYFPLIQNLNLNLSKLDTLFKQHSWIYFEEPKAPNFDIQKMHRFDSISSTINYLFTVSDESNSFYQNYKTAYWLLEYSDKNDFSMEVSIKIYFDYSHYKIKIFIGQPFPVGIMMKSYLKLTKSIDKRKITPFDSYKDYPLIEADYDETISEEKLIDFSNQISHEALEYIKLKANGVK